MSINPPTPWLEMMTWSTRWLYYLLRTHGATPPHLEDMLRLGSWGWYACFLKFVCNDVLSLMHTSLNAVFWLVVHFSINWSLISVWNLVIFWLLEVSGGVWGHFFIDFGCFGRPWHDFGRPVSIFDRFFVALGAQNGSLWDLKCPFWTFLGVLLWP